MYRYYEGKEFETKLKEKKPGDLSPELKEALSIPPLAPPPWLISMQRYGPPPSYPNLRIPGLNAPIPEGYVFTVSVFRIFRFDELTTYGFESYSAAWGFHPGGWGKPPLDDYGRPLYGDIYGVTDNANSLQVSTGSANRPKTARTDRSSSSALQSGEPIEKEPWGELEPDVEGTFEEAVLILPSLC